MQPSDRQLSLVPRRACLHHKCYQADLQASREDRPRHPYSLFSFSHSNPIISPAFPPPPTPTNHHILIIPYTRIKNILRAFAPFLHYLFTYYSRVCLVCMCVCFLLLLEFLSCTSFFFNQDLNVSSVICELCDCLQPI